LEKKHYHKWLFLVAAIWNWIIGLLFIIVSILAMLLAATLFEIAIPPSLVFIHTFFGFVFVFGFGFYFVSIDINNNRGIVKMAVIEKLFVFIVFLFYFIVGDLNFLGVIPVIIDLIFGCLFIEFLLNYK